jgi:long-chain-acyl-CoA dehydrogenase
VLALKRDVYDDKHEAFRSKLRSFLRTRLWPQYTKFETKGAVDRSFYAEMAQAGFYLRLNIPESFGGLGLEDWRYNAIVCEELENQDCGSVFANLGNDMVLSYFTESCHEEQRALWMPMLNRGAVIAVAMSEPEVGSDLGRLACQAKPAPDGDGWVVSGRKMWISSGSIAELVVVSCVTDPNAGSKGISLLVVEADMEGFSCAKRFAKLGKHASDTCLLTLDNVRVPRRNLIGDEGMGFIYMMGHLPKERLSIAVGSAAAARRALALATNYVHGRSAFGGVLGNLQSVQMKLAGLRTEVQACTSFVDRCIVDLAGGSLSKEAASMAKCHATECSCHVADICLQLFGGYGYLKNSPIAKIWADQRVTRIYGGSNEVQLEIAARGMGFQPQRIRSKL